MGKEKTRLIDLLIQSIEACGEEEGIWFGLSDDENKELKALIIKYKTTKT